MLFFNSSRFENCETKLSAIVTINVQARFNMNVTRELKKQFSSVQKVSWSFINNFYVPKPYIQVISSSPGKTIAMEYRGRVWVQWVRSPIDCCTQFRKSLILRTILITFLFFPSRVPGCSEAVPDCTRTCEFKRNSSNFDSAPNDRLCVLLSSSGVFFWSLCLQFQLVWCTPR